MTDWLFQHRLNGLGPEAPQGGGLGSFRTPKALENFSEGYFTGDLVVVFPRESDPPLPVPIPGVSTPRYGLDLDAMNLSIKVNGQLLATMDLPNSFVPPCCPGFSCYVNGDVFQVLPDLCR